MGRPSQEPIGRAHPADSLCGVPKEDDHGLPLRFGAQFISLLAVGGDSCGRPKGGDAGVPEPLFVLDLASEPARTEFTPPSLEGLDATEPPTLLEQEGSVVVYLGSRDDRKWFLILDGRSPSEPLDSDAKEDLMFLAGECAGLLFFRQLADAEENPNGK